MNFAQHLCQTISDAFLPAVHQNPAGLWLVAGFTLCNLGLYTFTRGKEFAITGFTAALFLVPFLKM